MIKLICGDAKTELKKMADECIDMMMTSPPYYGLRDYKVDGQIGLETTPAEYLQKLWAVFDEIKRVLKKEGTCFVNIGDTYKGGHPGGSTTGGLSKNFKQAIPQETTGRPQNKIDYAEKCLLLIPERFAIGMVERGWILRNRICWYKRNHMPSSVRDRFSCSWEYVYFFSKSKRYYFNLNSVRVPLKQVSVDRMARAILNDEKYDPKKHKHYDDQSENLMQVKHQHPMEILRNASKGYQKRMTKIPQDQSETPYWKKSQVSTG